MLNEAAVKVEVEIAEAGVRRVLHLPVLDRRVEVVDQVVVKVAQGADRIETAASIAGTSTNREIIATAVSTLR